MSVADFKQTLKDAVRQMSFRTSLKSLEKKGVQQVSVLGLDRIISLIEAAVHRSLRSRLVGVEREAVADATKAEFVRLLRTNEDLQRQKSEVEQQKERAEEEIDQLRRELGKQQKELELKLEEGALAVGNRYEGEDAVIAKKVAEVMKALAGAQAKGQGLPVGVAEEKVMELVMDVIAGERKAADEARRALQDREVDLLQRRIGKLNETLGHTERRLREVAALKDIDGGISSIYREVQGVNGDDAHAGKKKELMAEIFRANLELQKRLAR